MPEAGAKQSLHWNQFSGFFGMVLFHLFFKTNMYLRSCAHYGGLLTGGKALSMGNYMWVSLRSLCCVADFTHGAFKYKHWNKVFFWDPVYFLRNAPDWDGKHSPTTPKAKSPFFFTLAPIIDCPPTLNKSVNAPIFHNTSSCLTKSQWIILGFSATAENISKWKGIDPTYCAHYLFRGSTKTSPWCY